ncbi:MAG: DMT family transporter [Opitutaceae bacterium]
MVSHLGEIYSVTCALLWAIAVIFLRTASASVPAVELNVLKNVVGLFLFAGSFVVVGWDEFHNLTAEKLGLLSLSALLGITVADTFFLKALNLLGASRTAVVDCLYSPFVIVLSVFFLDESLRWGHLAGFILIIGGVLLATASTHFDRLPTGVLWKGLGYGALAMFLMASGVILSKPILADTSPLAVSAWRLMVGFLGCVAWILVSGRTKQSIRVFRGPLPWVSIFLGASLGSWLSLLVWMAGFKYTEASTASILNQTSIIFIIILAALFLREPIGWRRATGVFLGFAGVAAIFLLP